MRDIAIVAVLLFLLSTVILKDGGAKTATNGRLNVLSAQAAELSRTQTKRL